MDSGSSAVSGDRSGSALADDHHEDLMRMLQENGWQTLLRHLALGILHEARIDMDVASSVLKLPDS